MKRTPLRRKSKDPLKKTKDEADRALQDYCREIHRGEYCEFCKINPFQVSHHFIEKSQSNALRYDLKNLVFICHECHFSIHRGSKRAIFDLTIRKKRGEEWSEYILLKARESVKYYIGDYRKFKEMFTL